MKYMTAKGLIFRPNCFNSDNPLLIETFDGSYLSSLSASLTDSILTSSTENEDRYNDCLVPFFEHELQRGRET
jgi:hypothetical protein